MVRLSLMPFLALAFHTAVAATATLRQDIYVWQRTWTDAVTNAVTSRAERFGELLALAAEVSWTRTTPKCVTVDLDYAALRSNGTPVGLALRIGTYPGPFQPRDEQTRYLTEVARSLVMQAETHQLEPAELQLDFDCAETKLEGYKVWLQAIRDAVRPCPVTITALPVWLDHPEFKALAEGADGYVLQVHSFERPRSPKARFKLCDPEAAKHAVTRAAALGLSFRVALPTYGYVVAFDGQGQFLGLSAEGPVRDWPDTARIREVCADPQQLADLVRGWHINRPTKLSGILWYRMPVDGDVMNWTWPTLQCVMAGTRPVAALRAEVRRLERGLYELDLTNDGTGDTAFVGVASVHWDGAQKIAADAIRGYEILEDTSNVLQFRSGTVGEVIRAGERITLGWIRFDADPTVETDLHEVAK